MNKILKPLIVLGAMITTASAANLTDKLSELPTSVEVTKQKVSKEGSDKENLGLKFNMELNTNVDLYTSYNTDKEISAGVKLNTLGLTNKYNVINLYGFSRLEYATIKNDIDNGLVYNIITHKMEQSTIEEKSEDLRASLGLGYIYLDYKFELEYIKSFEEKNDLKRVGIEYDIRDNLNFIIDYYKFETNSPKDQINFGLKFKF